MERGKETEGWIEREEKTQERKERRKITFGVLSGGGLRLGEVL